MTTRIRAIAAAATVAVGLYAGAAGAAPFPAPSLDAGGDAVIERIAGGCGPGFHPNPWGICRPNWGPRPFYGRPYAYGYGYGPPPRPVYRPYGFYGPRPYY